MTQIKNSVELLQAYASGTRDFSGADLSGANLRDAYLRDANLRGANLSGAYLRDANLSRAYLRGADLSGANLSRAYLRDAVLGGAYLSRAYLRDAVLGGADLRDAYLRDANLYGAVLSGANLRDANLYGANLSGAVLSGANLRGANLSGAKGLAEQVITPEGVLVVYKKTTAGVVVLRIPAKAARVNAYGARKCRAEYAVVVEAPEGAVSMHDQYTKYVVGRRVTAAGWDPDPRVTCSGGIHFFLTRAEAEAY